MKATGLNHVSIHARDLEESTRFYEEFFGMRRVATPDFGYPVQWLEVGERCPSIAKVIVLVLIVAFLQIRPQGIYALRTRSLA